jgi:hypothetical protein
MTNFELQRIFAGGEHPGATNLPETSMRRMGQDLSAGPPPVEESDFEAAVLPPSSVAKHRVTI